MEISLHLVLWFCSQYSFIFTYIILTSKLKGATLISLGILGLIAWWKELSE